MSGTTGSEHSEAFHVYLHRNLPLYLYNCILVAGFDKPHVFTSLVEPAAVNRMEDYVRNCVVPALTSREERQRYVGLFADKPQLFQISPGHRIQLMMLVKEYRNNKGHSYLSSTFGTPVSSNNTDSDGGSDTFRRRSSENDSILRTSAISTSSKLISGYSSGSITSNFAGYKRKASDSSPTVTSPVSTVPQGPYLNNCSAESSVRSQQSFKFDPSQHSSSNRISLGLSDDASNSTCISIDSDHLSRVAFQPGNNATQYASPLSVDEHERRILRLLERWVKAQPDPLIQNLRRDVDFQLTVTRQTENDVVTAKVMCLRCKKSVALVGRGDTWVLSNYHRHLRSCLSNERHISYVASSVFDRDDGIINGLYNSDEPSNGTTHSNINRDDSIGPRFQVGNLKLHYPMKTESVASDISIVEESGSENGRSSVATPRDNETTD